MFQFTWFSFIIIIINMSSIKGKEKPFGLLVDYTGARLAGLFTILILSKWQGKNNILIYFFLLFNMAKNKNTFLRTWKDLVPYKKYLEVTYWEWKK